VKTLKNKKKENVEEQQKENKKRGKFDNKKKGKFEDNKKKEKLNEKETNQPQKIEEVSVVIVTDKQTKTWNVDVNKVTTASKGGFPVLRPKKENPNKKKKLKNQIIKLFQNLKKTKFLN